MSHIKVPQLAKGFGCSVLIALGIASQALAQGPAVAYPPYGSAIPIITNTEHRSGAVGEDTQKMPAPNGPNEESIWNMKVEGFNDNQARPVYQPLIVNQNGREIMYNGDLSGTAMNPQTGVSESNGTSIIDVTNVKRPKFLFHIPGPDPINGSFAAAGAQMVRVCPGSTMPNAAANGIVGKFFLLRAFGNAGANDGAVGAEIPDHDLERLEQHAQKLVGMRHGHSLCGGRRRERWLAAERIEAACLHL